MHAFCNLNLQTRFVFVTDTCTCNKLCLYLDYICNSFKLGLVLESLKMIMYAQLRDNENRHTKSCRVFFFVNISKESLDWLTIKPARKYDVNQMADICHIVAQFCQYLSNSYVDYSNFYTVLSDLFAELLLINVS